MKIAFIRPSMFGRQTKDAMMPLVFAIIKPLTPDDVKITFYDEKIEELPVSLDADIVAMTVETFTAKRAYNLALKYKKENKKVIMGGFHPTMMADECLNYADSVVIGEAEDTWPKIISDLKNSCLKKKYESSNNIDMSLIKYDYEVFKEKNYNKIGLVQFSRGCKFSCDFCSVHAFYKDKIRCKSIEIIIDEIKAMREKYIFFIDDNIFSNEEEAKKLFKALIPLKKKWFCQISMDIASDKLLLNLMKESGCILVVIGFESLNRENLKKIGKIANLKYQGYKNAIENIYGSGIMIYATFVIGYEGDTTASTRDLLKFALENKFAIANFNPLMPMPGTRLFERLEKNGKLPYGKWWINPDYRYGDSMVYPELMSGPELMEACKRARYEFYSYKNILKRLFNFKINYRSFENAFLFFAANLISKIEIKSKQGIKLGGD